MLEAEIEDGEDGEDDGDGSETAEGWDGLLIEDDGDDGALTVEMDTEFDSD
jgi:hypothetical protein